MKINGKSIYNNLFHEDEDTVNCISEGIYVGRDRNMIFIFLESNNQPVKASYVDDNVTYSESAHVSIEGRECYGNAIHLKQSDDSKIITLIDILLIIQNAKEKMYSSLDDIFRFLKQILSTKPNHDKQSHIGIYGELLFIKFMYENGIDVSDYYAKWDRNKYDFEISNKVAIEVKATTKSMRIHHVRHNQIVNHTKELYLASVMLRKSEKAMNIKELFTWLQENINFPREIQKRMHLLLHSKNLLSEQFYMTESFRLELTDSQAIKIYDTKDIRTYNEEEPEAVSNTSYQLDVSGEKEMDIEKFISNVKDSIDKNNN